MDPGYGYWRIVGRDYRNPPARWIGFSVGSGIRSDVGIDAIESQRDDGLHRGSRRCAADVVLALPHWAARIDACWRRGRGRLGQVDLCPKDGNRGVMMLYTLFAALALSTFLPRFLPLTLWRNRDLPGGVRVLLGYVPPAILAAIFVPGIVAPDEVIKLDAFNPYLIGGLVTFVMMRVTQRLLLSVIVGVAVFYVMLRSFALI
jgi:branched-subunit amino acid transport protein